MNAKNVAGNEPWGHPMKPVPLMADAPRLTRVSTYVEDELDSFLAQYAGRAGMSKSHALRRLAILGAMSEGYVFSTDDVALQQRRKG